MSVRTSTGEWSEFPCIAKSSSAITRASSCGSASKAAPCNEIVLLDLRMQTTLRAAASQYSIGGAHSWKTSKPPQKKSAWSAVLPRASVVLLAREFLVPCPPLLMTLALASFWLWLALLSIHWPRWFPMYTYPLLSRPPAASLWPPQSWHLPH